MKANGLQAAGYTLINVGGNGHAVNGSNDPAHSSATAIGHNGKPSPFGSEVLAKLALHETPLVSTFPVSVPSLSW